MCSVLSDVSYSADNIVGPPRIFPRYGDYTQALVMVPLRSFLPITFPSPHRQLTLAHVRAMVAGSVGRTTAAAGPVWPHPASRGLH